ncbi:right-handed parallel beta-helix repeat-containing protein [Clostridium nigeriense]|uniref:right-handed parallel beta-helix repeat-containing protein n=1 Tax=Clostridium nigeriense TaxID=1805470 RepID=UPI003D356988
MGKNKQESIRIKLNDLENIKVESPKNTNGIVVNILDFGATQERDKCNYEALKKAIEYCREIKASKLEIPKGKYYFNTSLDNGEAQIKLDGLSDITINGNGAEFIFSSDNKFISINSCTRLEIKNLFLDWNWDKEPLASLGRIINVAKDGSYFDCEFPSFKNIKDSFEIRIVGPFNPKEVKPGNKGALEFRPYKNNHVIESDDEKSNKDMEKLVRELSNIIKGMKKIQKNVMRFYTTDFIWTLDRIKKDQVYNFRHYEYESTAIYLTDSNNINLESITIYSCPGSGIVGRGKLHNFTINKCKVVRKPGTSRSITTSADCIHIGNSQGNFIIEDCEFSYAGDDCINIHDNTSMGVKIIGDKSIIAKRVDKERNAIYEGDILEFRNGDFSETGYSSKVKSVKYNEEEVTCTIELEDKAPENLNEKTIIFNRRYCTENYIIRNNKFHSNRARGVLIHGSNGIIEGNSFYKIQGAAIQIEAGAESRWAEGTGVNNVIFRNNFIESCDLNRWTMAVIYMGVYLPDGRCNYPMFNNIIFENNTIVDCPRLAFYLSSCSDIFILNNTIINPNTETFNGRVYGSSQSELPIYEEYYQGTIEIVKAKDVVVENNERIEYVDTYSNGIYFDKGNTSNITVKNNYGFI